MKDVDPETLKRNRKMALITGSAFCVVFITTVYIFVKFFPDVIIEGLTIASIIILASEILIIKYIKKQRQSKQSAS